MRRQLMIESLITDSLVRILDRQHVRWLGEILESGFAGFAHMTDQELRSELSKRGLAHDQDADRINADAGNDSMQDEDDADLRALLQDSRGGYEWSRHAPDSA